MGMAGPGDTTKFEYLLKGQPVRLDVVWKLEPQAANSNGLFSTSVLKLREFNAFQNAPVLTMPQLPPELIEAVIEEIGDHPASLQACSLVSNAFAVISQRRLFRFIHLKSPITRVLASSPHLASYVRDLHVHLVLDEEHQDGLRKGIWLLNNVHRLTITAVWEGPCAWDSFAADLTGSLHFIMHIAFAPVLGFLQSSQGTPRAYSSRPRIDPALHALLLDDEMAPTLGRLNHLELAVRGSVDTSLVGFEPITLKSGPCLQHLTINFGKILVYREGSGNPVRLPLLYNLRSVTLEANVGELRIPASIIYTIASLPSSVPDLETLRIVLTAVGENAPTGEVFGQCNVSEVAATLTTGFSFLRAVHWSIFCDAAETFEARVRKSLPLPGLSTFFSTSTEGTKYHPMSVFSDYVQLTRYEFSFWVVVYVCKD
ncbi:hypothetical protein C8F04DRAFT_1185070 [Mycena alexandri]|uniref:F-box domain-containing protein n=1 Tax=Mycena alexandri TaxID=1745969 RepID=A0AAD6SRP6_9AGAR|nr:hypothetical protein C8F04DRAFT_1185070 [Mycena alexandri]